MDARWLVAHHRSLVARRQLVSARCAHNGDSESGAGAQVKVEALCPDVESKRKTPNKLPFPPDPALEFEDFSPGIQPQICRAGLGRPTCRRPSSERQRGTTRPGVEPKPICQRSPKCGTKSPLGADARSYGVRTPPRTIIGFPRCCCISSKSRVRFIEEGRGKRA